MPPRTTPEIMTASPMFRRPLFVPAQSKSNQYAGRTTLASGSATVTVSTTVVNSDSIVWMGLAAPGTNVASGQFKAIEVKSIDAGNAFVLGTADGVAMARDTVVMWTIVHTS